MSGELSLYLRKINLIVQNPDEDSTQSMLIHLFLGSRDGPDFGFQSRLLSGMVFVSDSMHSLLPSRSGAVLISVPLHRKFRSAPLRFHV